MNRLDDVIGLDDERGALLQQGICPGGARVEGMAWYGKDVSAEVGRVACGGERAGSARRLDHENGVRKTRNDAVAAWKVIAARTKARRHLADQAAVFGNGGLKIIVLGWLCNIDAADADGNGGMRKRRLMGAGVDAASKA